MGSVYVPRSVLELCAQPALKSFHDISLSYVALLDPVHLSEYTRKLMRKLTNPALLILSLFAWDITCDITWNIDASSFTCSLRTQIPFQDDMQDHCLKMKSLKRIHGQYCQLAVESLEKEDFGSKVEDLLDLLDDFFNQFLEKELESEELDSAEYETH